MSYKPSTDLVRGHAKMTRAAEAKRIIDYLGDDTKPPMDIARGADVDDDKLKTGFLHELSSYGILTCERQAGGGGPSLWSVNKPSNIESLKADMLAVEA